LGEGGFGKVVLAKEEGLDGSDQLFAIEMLKKAHIINRCNVSFTITGKQSLPHF
jgi:serine/threonine protein kinase